MAKETRPWDRLTITRERAGHTRTSLATALNSSAGYIHDLENGRREPNPAFTLRIAQVLNVPVSYIEKHDRIEGRVSA